MVGVGTELLLGQIANTNAQHISSALASIGVDVYYHSVVGDNLERVAGVLRTALARSDTVVVTGGLGPTPDDLTRDAVAHVLGVPLVRDPGEVARLRAFFEARGRTFPSGNERQADFPRGAVPIAAEGTAPGFVVEHDGAVLFALPGVPWEMRAMLDGTVLPELRRRAGDAVTLSREVLVVGLGESHVHERIAELDEAQSNPTIAYLASAGRVRVRITAKARTERDARDLIAPVEADVRARLAPWALEGGSSPAEALGAALRARGLTIAVAESLTGGLLASEIVDVPGASDYFRGGVVAYADDAKRDVVGVDAELLRRAGAVSDEAARALAAGAARAFGADLGVSTTGVAGPGPHDGVAAGTVYVGTSLGGRAEARRVHGYGDRANVRAVAVTFALDAARRALAERA
ncbi:MAG TPA: competence/damage-inducible protein A [Actinomycetota bacterium]|nr:competence/damage-inducible protein A [Actinomycetota bacterium]